MLIRFWLVFASLLVAPLFAQGEPEATNTPALANIVLINADDLGYGDLGCYGATRVKTPYIDKLAAEGRRFTDAHSASAVCSPSRYGLLTGRYPLRKNLWGPVSLRQPLTIDVQRLTLASLLREAGYRTACIGKWHLGFGMDEPNWNGKLAPGPLEVGFQTYFGLPSVNSGPPFVYVQNHRVLGLDPADPLVYGERSVTRRFFEKGGYTAIGGGEKAHRLYDDELVGTRFTEEAVQWIGKQEPGQPFFLYLATTQIHHPFTPAKRFVGTSDCRRYGDFIHELDWMVGEILRTLEEKGLAKNTLVLFTSDNGGMLNVTGQQAWTDGHRLNGKLLGFKFGAWEGGHRVPLIARWPGRIPEGTTSDHLIGHVDLLATFGAIVGRPLETGEGDDSLNQLEVLTKSPEEPVRKTLILTPNSPRHLAVRHENWVYIPDQGAGGFQGKRPGDHLFSDAAALDFAGYTNSDIVDGKVIAEAPPAQLYDLARDPYQTTNVYRQHPGIVKKLAGILEGYRTQIPETERIGWINLKQ